MRRIVIISAVVYHHVIPLCWANSEEYALDMFREHPLMYDLYQREDIWFETVEIEESKLKNLVHINNYFDMYDTPVF